MPLANMPTGRELIVSKFIHAQYSVAACDASHPAKLMSTHLAFMFLLYNTCSVINCGKACCLSRHVFCNLSACMSPKVVQGRLMRH